MRITNLNPDTDIGASGWLVQIDGHGLLMDAGVHPKREGRDSLPVYGTVRDQEVDAIAISHCHHDHVGSLPVALRYFPQAHVLMTELSYFLVERVLHNSVNVMTRQRDEMGIREYPLFTHDEIDDIAPLFHGDTLHAESTVTRARASKSRPDAGIVHFEHRGYNQRDELVALCERAALMRRSNAAPRGRGSGRSPRA